jgi:hypothetical protein
LPLLRNKAYFSSSPESSGCQNIMHPEAKGVMHKSSIHFVLNSLFLESMRSPPPVHIISFLIVLPLAIDSIVIHQYPSHPSRLSMSIINPSDTVEIITFSNCSRQLLFKKHIIPKNHNHIIGHSSY